MRIARGARRIAGGVLLLCAHLGSALAQTQADPEAASGFTPKPLARAEKWMVIAAHPLAAEAGLLALRKGGSAADAAIAAQLALSVVEPQSSGIGGGGFALHWRASESALSAWDGRETAPSGARPDQFLREDGRPRPFIEAATSGIAVGAPGLVRMLEALHREGGRLPWPRLFDVAIRLAEQGFAVTPRLNASIALMAPRLKLDATARRLFFTEAGEPLPAGAWLRQPELAASLRALAEGGADALHIGALAEKITSAVQSEPLPGTLSTGDLAAYRPAPRDPVCLLYRERFRVCGMPPPSSGGATVAQILGLMQRAEGEPADPAARAHLFLEASRLAYADRDRYLADPDFVPAPLEGLLEPDYLAMRAALIVPDVAGPIPAEPGAPSGAKGPEVSGPGRDRPGTTHLTVIDGEGSIVALTSSIETSFGAARMAGGFLLNNQLTDFAFRPEIDGRPVANAVAPGRRPRSSMAPTIVFDAESGRPLLALGSPGGSRIIEYVALALVRLLDEGLDPAEAASGPNLSHRNRAATVEGREDADALADALAGYGHAVARASMVSGLHILQIGPEGALLGGADPRREGVALGD